VIKRLVSLIATNATLEAEREAAMKQAQSASRAAESLMDAGDSKKASEKEKELEKKVKSAEEGKTYGFMFIGSFYGVAHHIYNLLLRRYKHKLCSAIQTHFTLLFILI